MTTEKNEQQQNITQANQLAEALADSAWQMTAEWGEFAKSSIGLPLTQALDGIGLQLVMSLGRKSIKEHMQFISNARKYLTPASYWLQRAAKRGLVDTEQAQAMREQMAALAKRLDQHAHSILQSSNEAQAALQNGEIVPADNAADANKGSGESPSEITAAHR